MKIISTDISDRRKQYIRLSDKGRSLMDKAFQEIGARFMERTKSLTEEERSEVESALELLQTKVFN